MAFIEGTKPDKYIVVGAHLDHVGSDRRGRVLNGADDNASGSAIILEMAKRLSRGKPVQSVVFVWFTAEERGLVGSKQFAAYPFDGDADKENNLPTFMLNLDMVGHLDARMADEPGKEPGGLDDLYVKYPFAKRITSQGGGSGSDHASFTKKRVPSIFLHTGVGPTYHKYTDDANTLDYAGMESILDYAYDLMMLKAGVATAPIDPEDYLFYGRD
jgi:Zn-dependent M28 family amino/carboxypeptidase